MESSCGVTAEQWAMARKAGRKAAVISVLPEAFNREGAKEREKQTGWSFIKNRPWGGGGGDAACFLESHSGIFWEQNGNSFDSLRATFGET